MRLGNPAIKRLVNQQQKGQLGQVVNPASYGGIAKKSILFGVATLASAMVVVLLLFTALQTQSEALLSTLLIGLACSGVPTLIVALVVAFVPSTVKILGFVYCLLQGGTLGFVVCLVEFAYHGVALTAFLGTVIVFVLCLALNKYLQVRISGKFFRVVVIAFSSLVLLELALSLLYAFGVVNLWADMFWLQTAISALCIVLASISLLWDLQYADYVVKAGLDAKYEWNVAFSLVLTLIYIYVELLELLLRLMALRDNR